MSKRALTPPMQHDDGGFSAEIAELLECKACDAQHTVRPQNPQHATLDQEEFSGECGEAMTRKAQRSPSPGQEGR